MTTKQIMDNPFRRNLMLLFCITALMPVLATAQDYPIKAITIVVPFTAGGPTDVLTRLVAQAMAKDLGQPVVVENLGGAGGSIAQAKVARAPADGYTLLVGNVGSLAVTGSLYDKLSYNAATDFTTIASMGDATQVLSVRAELPVSNLNEFADYVKANQAKMNYGTGGVGSGAHLGGLLLNATLGANVQPVHYRGGIQATQDVMAGNIDYMIESSSTAVSSISTGKIKGLSVLRKDRISALPDVGASGESKYPGMLYEIWNMMVAPRNISPAIAARLNSSVNKVLADPAMLKQFEARGLSVPTPAHRSLVGSSELLKSEIIRWRELIERAGAKADSKR